MGKCCSKKNIDFTEIDKNENELLKNKTNNKPKKKRTISKNIPIKQNKIDSIPLYDTDYFKIMNNQSIKETIITNKKRKFRKIKFIDNKINYQVKLV